jgi:hypothetical protein
VCPYNSHFFQDLASVSEAGVEPFFADYLVLLQDLNRNFIATFDDLPDEALDWVPGTDMNSFCVLVVHTTGSTRFWIGLACDDVPNRNRDLEFQAKGLSKAQLKAHFEAVEEYTRNAFERSTPIDFTAVRPVPNQGERRVSTGWALLHALEHIGLHLGHAQITRQLWEQR